MSKCLLDIDDTLGNENNTNYKKLRVYTPKKLNKELLNNTKQIASDYFNIIIIGEIVDTKLWRSSGMSFKLMEEGESFECNVWLRDGCSIDKVVEHTNMKCRIMGYIDAKYFYGHKFVLNVTDIQLETNDTKLQHLKDACNERGYFINKKKIPEWNTIKQIGIISKLNTQGYNDFIQQFTIPLSIITKEITLEGPRTAKQCISSIEILQNMDLIIIIRGGGSTSEISNSFDKLDLFEAIHKSKVPIITAIGHEADKGDKLLITTVSDLDYPTPSTAATEISKIFINPITTYINNILFEIQKIFHKKFSNKYKIAYDDVVSLFNKLKLIKFGSDIIQISKDMEFVIVERDNIFYKIYINLENKMDIPVDDVMKIRNISRAIKDCDFVKVKKYTLGLSKDITPDLIKKIDVILKLKKTQLNFEKTTPKRMKILCYKPFDLNKYNLNKLTQLNKLFLWYKASFDESTYDKEGFDYFVKQI